MSIRPVFAFLFCAALPALAQSTNGNGDKTLPFANTSDAEHQRQIATVIGGLTASGPVPVPGALAVRGAAEEVALAEWLMKALDRVPDAASPQARNLAPGEFRLATGEENLVRVVHLPWVQTPQELAEVSTVVRSVGDIRRLYVYEPLKTISMRGTPEQIAMADWLVAQLGFKDAASRTPKFQLKGTGEHVLCVMDASFTRTPQELAEAATVVRGLADLRRVFTYNVGRVVVARGTEDQIALADWLFQQLASKPATRAIVYDHAVPEPVGVARPAAAIEDRLTIFFPAVTDADALAKVATALRVEVQLRRVFAYGAARALAVRGNAEQLAMADRLLRERGYLAP